MYARAQYQAVDGHQGVTSATLAAVAVVSVCVGVATGLFASSQATTGLAVSGLTNVRPAVARATTSMPAAYATTRSIRVAQEPMEARARATSGQLRTPTPYATTQVPAQAPSMAPWLLIPCAVAGVIATAWNVLRSKTATVVEPSHQIEWACMAVAGRKVAILGAAGGIGQPLSLLMKDYDPVSHLALYDLAPITPGVAVDLSHCPTPTICTGHKGAEELDVALKGAEVVIIPAGVARRPGMTRDDLFNTNAGILKSLAEACVKNCPNAVIVVIANPVNSLVPIAAEVFKKAGCHDPRKIIGVTALDVCRANTWVAEMTGKNPRDQEDVVVIGGHAGTTILPLLSQIKGANFTDEQIKTLSNRIQFGGDEVVAAKDGGGSATLSMAYAGADFAKKIIRAMNGEKGIIACCYTENAVTDASFFAVPTTLGPNGAEAVHKFGELSDFEQANFDEMLPTLKAQIQKGIDFANQ